MKREFFIISKKYGLGKACCDSDDPMFTDVLLYEDNTTVKYLSKFENVSYYAIPDDIIRTISSINIARQFSSEVIARAKNYVRTGKMSDFDYSPTNKVISVMIHGTETYKTSIGFRDLSLLCTCPVERQCKHLCALLMYLQDGLNLLRDALVVYKEQKTKTANVTASEPNDNMKFLRLFYKNEVTEKSILEMYHFFKDNCPLSPYDIVSYLYSHEKGDPHKSTILFDILLIAAYRPQDIVKIYTKISRWHLSPISTEIENISIDNRKSNWYKECISLQYRYIGALCLDDPLFLFARNLSFYRYRQCSLLMSGLHSLLEKYRDDDRSRGNQFEFLLPLVEHDLYLDEIKYLTSRFTPNEAKNILERMRIPSSLLTCFSDDTLCHSYAYASGADYTNLLISKFPSLSEVNKTTLACGLIRLGHVRSFTSEQRRLIAKYPEKDLIMRLAQDYRYWRYDISLLDKEYRKPFPFDKAVLTKYTNCEFSLSIDNGLLAEHYCLELVDGYKLITITKLDGKYYGVNDIVDPEDDALFAHYLIDTIKNNPYYQKEFIEYVKTVQQLKDEKFDKEAKALFDVVEQKALEKLVMTSSTQAQVGLDYSFSFDDREMYISLKVGITKKYVVSNIINFLDKFDEGELGSYGKFLSFYHTLDNIEPRDQDVIALLCGIKTRNRFDNKKMPLHYQSVISIFDLLKGRYITYNDNEYLLSLDTITLKVKIDKDYKLSLIGVEDVSILDLNGSMYLFSRKTNRVDIIKDSKKNQALYDLVFNLTGKTIKRVKEAFNEKVYQTYANLIEVDPAIQSDFTISKMEIQSFFDINKKQHITLQSKFFIKGEEVTREDIDNVRDLQLLNRYRKMISELGFVDGEIEDEDKNLLFLRMNLSNLKDISTVFLSDVLQNTRIIKFIPPKLKMQYDNQMMSVFTTDSLYTEDELSLVLDALKKRRKFVILKDDRILDISAKDCDKFHELTDDLSLDKEHLNNGRHIPVYQALSAFKYVDQIELDDYLAKMVNDIATFKSADYQVPKVNASLRKYQVEGYKWLKVLSSYSLGGVLADDMGLGKTLEIITLLKSDESKKPSLIVCPKSLIFNWQNEFFKFDPDTEVKAIYGATSYRHQMISEIKDNSKVIYFTSYDSLRNDVEEYANISFNYLVLDEAQYIKNMHALKTKKVKEIHAEHKFALTGTPIENDIFDLYSIFDFLMPKYLPSINSFKAQAGNSDFQSSIATKVAPFILRRTKKEVLKDLPNKNERFISAEMSGEQRRIYSAHCMEAKKILADNGKAFDVLYLLTRLRQICVDPGTFIENYTEESGKMILLKEILPEYINNGHRILLFSSFVSSLNLIEKYLNNNHINYLMLTGATSSKKRIESVNEFNKNENIKVFLISLKAGGNGLNLTGADTVIHFDPWWNLSAENQATDRAHRIGQTKNVEVIKLIMEDSIEQRVIELQNMKKDLVDRLISDDDSSIERITIDDLKFILE